MVTSCISFLGIVTSPLGLSSQMDWHWVAFGIWPYFSEENGKGFPETDAWRNDAVSSIFLLIAGVLWMCCGIILHPERVLKSNIIRMDFTGFILSPHCLRVNMFTRL